MIRKEVKIKNTAQQRKLMIQGVDFQNDKENLEISSEIY